jgi:flagellar motility protein MotE (MotC chaperone)
MADGKIMRHFSFQLVTGLTCAYALLAGSWAYAQNSPTAPQPEPTPKAQTEPPQLPTQPASVSPETLRLLEMIERKNRELKKREEELLLKEKNLEALEKKVLSDLQKIEEALARSEEMVGIKKDLIEKNVKALVKAYSNMKPVQAAALLESMDEGTAIIIISRMNSRVAGKVLGAMKTKIAKNITEKIAGKKSDTN